jgi:murein DD-endopeptidase
MIKRLFAGAIVLLLIPLCALAQAHSGFPVDIIAGPSPQPVMADGHLHLLYELHLTNFAPLPIELKGLDILGDSASTLASYRDVALEKMVVPVEELSSAASPTEAKGTLAIGEGHAVMIFIDLILDSGARPPAELRQRFWFSVPRKNKATIERNLDGPAVPVLRDPVPVLSAPLRGSTWVAFNALGAEDHRRSLNAFSARERIPQRFAIDCMRLGPDGRLFHGDTKSNANYYGYRSEVVAVADGRLSDLKDGLPENSGSTERSARIITLENALGNYDTLDLGQGRFATYAYLQPGSFKVKLGEQVKAGQILGLLGNSGNSDAPHLHLQLVNANSPFESEGVPYELDSFTQLGTVPDDPAAQDTGEILLPKEKEKPAVRRDEFPLNNAAVNFP